MGTVVACFPIIGLADDQYLEYQRMINKLKQCPDPAVKKKYVAKLYAVQLSSHQKKDLGTVDSILGAISSQQGVSLSTYIMRIRLPRLY